MSLGVDPAAVGLLLLSQDRGQLGAPVVLFAVGWFLARELYASGKLEDCLMSGRTNCAPINTH